MPQFGRQGHSTRAAGNPPPFAWSSVDSSCDPLGVAAAGSLAPSAPHGQNMSSLPRVLISNDDGRLLMNNPLTDGCR